MYDIYLIEPGDTIENIANRYGVSIEVIRDLNPNNSFAVGNRIIVPTLNEFFSTYTIEKGDTLYEIARRYNTDYNLLALLNGLNISDYIYPGTNILIPKKDIKYYLTNEGDTLFSVSQRLKSDLNKLLRQNRNIYLKEGGLIVYKEN